MVTKKGAIEFEKLVALGIVLVVAIIIIVGFNTIWGRGQDTTEDIVDYDPEDCEDDTFNPFSEECILFLFPSAGLIEKLKKKRKG